MAVRRKVYYPIYHEIYNNIAKKEPKIANRLAKTAWAPRNSAANITKPMEAKETKTRDGFSMI
jgi:hypothetical protein